MTTKAKAILKTVNEGLAETASTASDAVDTITQTGAGAFDKAKKVAADGLDSVSSAVSEGASDAADVATGYAKQALKQAKRVAAQVEGEWASRRKELFAMVKRHPVSTVAVAVGVGLLLGRVIPRAVRA